MRLTRYTDYSFRVLIYLAAQPDAFGTVQSISDAYQISKNHLMKVVQALSQRGYVDTIRGKGGGMRLRLPPERINVGRVVRDMESDLELVECFGPDNRCVITPECMLKNVLGMQLCSPCTFAEGTPKCIARPHCLYESSLDPVANANFTGVSVLWLMAKSPYCMGQVTIHSR